jgi:hypothetical protein
MMVRYVLLMEMMRMIEGVEGQLVYYLSARRSLLPLQDKELDEIIRYLP